MPLFPIRVFVIALGLLLSVAGVSAATIVWSGASGTDTNWSTAGNWVGGTVPAGGDDVKLVDAGTNLVAGVANSLVDLSFGGYIGSLQFGQSNGFHTVQIAAGQTLNLTNVGGLFVGTSGDVGAARVLTNSIKGAGATLNLNNTAANLVLNQGQASANGSRAVLDLSGVDNFNANIFSIGIGSIHFQNAVAQRNSGILLLARTNNIRLNLTNTLANYATTGTPTNAIELVHVGAGNNASALSFLYLGQTNAVYVDSLGIGKSKASASSAATMTFNPAFAAPSAFFRGVGGNASRVTWWGIADMADSASSAQLSIGTNDFSLGTVDALVETMSLGRDCAPQHTSAGFNVGVLTFTAGTMDVNNLIAGNQVLGPATSFAGNLGIVNVNGAAAKLVVNNTLELGHTTVAFVPGTGGTNAAKTYGILNIRNGGIVLANRIIVGAASTNNNSITLNSGTLVVTNGIGSPASRPTTFAVTNATVRLNITGITNIFCANLVSSGATNLIGLDSVAVFASYPKQVTLIKFTSQLGVGVTNFGIGGALPAAAPGAYLSNNIANSSLDLVLPNDPRPVVTSTPNNFASAPGVDVTLAANYTGVAPLFPQWRKDGVNLADGPTGSGAILAGTSTASLTITNAQEAESGSYVIVVTNVFGAVTSAPPTSVTISTNDIAPIVTGPFNQTVTQGNSATFTASVSGNPAPYLQWQKNGADITGENLANLTIVNAQYPADQTTYSLVATNVAGKVTNSATLTVIVRPVITLQPVNVVVTNTQAAAFTVAATGVPAPSFKWSKNGSPLTDGGTLSGSSSATLAFSSVAPSDIATYSVTITNQAGVTNSASVTLTVNSLMPVTVLSPNNGATSAFYDTPLAITFNQTPTLRAAGTIKIFNASNSSTPVDTINLSLGNPQQRSFVGDGQSFTYYAVTISGSTATIYPHSSVMTSNQTYYVTVDNGVFTDASGAYFVGITDTNAWRFTTKPGGAVNPTSLVVASDGSGDFLTVQGAVNSIPSGNTTPSVINIRNGDYNEIVDIAGKHNVTFRGQSRLGTIVGYANNATFQVANGGSTHARMAFKVNANDIAIENLTVTNRTPVGGSQAEALMIESNARRFILNNAHVGSYQDTILANQNSSEAYFYNSQIEGQYDYIWGGGRLFFTNCELRTLVGSGGALNTGNLTASRTDLAGTNGFAFMRCQFTRIINTISNTTVADANGTAGGNVAFISCNFDANYTNPASSVISSQILWEFGNSNLDNTISRTFGLTALTEGDGRLTAARSSTIWLNGWVPALAPNIISQPTNRIASAGQAASFAVSATGIPEPTYQWLKNGSPISGATGASYNLPSAVRTNAGNYSVVAINSSGSVTSLVATLTYTGNVVPTTSPTSYVRPAGYSFKISVPDLAANWSDADGDALALASTISSTNGATVSYDASYIYYSNPNGVSDQINYTIGDGQGGTAAGLITITVSTNPVAGTPQSITVSGGSATVNFAGIPAYQYEIQRSTNFVDWVTVLTTNAPASGLFMFTDSFADLGGTSPATAFYRTAHP